MSILEKGISLFGPFTWNYCYGWKAHKTHNVQLKQGHQWQPANECCQFKQYLGFLISQENLKTLEINVMAFPPNLAILIFCTTIPLASCEAKKGLFKTVNCRNKRGSANMINRDRGKTK